MTIKTNIQFLSSALVMSVLGITSVSAAPSVKMLGANTARVGTNAAVVKSENSTTAPTQRLGSIRAKNVTSNAPVTINKVPSKINTTTDSTEESRLSLGKYIHTTGVSTGTIKPGTATTVNTGVSSSDFVNLMDRVKTLEDDKFTIGDGLVVDSNNKISVDTTILQNHVENTIEEQIDDILEEHGVTVDPTYPSVTNEDSSYDSIQIADEFDENFDFTD